MVRESNPTVQQFGWMGSEMQIRQMQFDEKMGGVKVMNTAGWVRSAIWVGGIHVEHK